MHGHCFCSFFLGAVNVPQLGRQSPYLHRLEGGGPSQDQREFKEAGARL